MDLEENTDNLSVKITDLVEKVILPNEVEMGSIKKEIWISLSNLY